MTIVHLFIGLPGSGKSYLAKRMFMQQGGIFLDDKFYPTDFMEAVHKNPTNIYITDPYLCMDVQRTAAINFIKALHIGTIVTYWFENNVEKAIKNIKHRNDGRIINHTALKNVFSKNYHPPEGETLLPIWEPEAK